MLLSLWKKYPLIIQALILTPVLAFLVVLSAGGGEGDGTKILFKLIYPYTVFAIAGFQVENNDMMAAIGYAGFFLYVYYSIIVTIADRRGRMKETVRILVIAHSVAALFCVFLLS